VDGWKFLHAPIILTIHFKLVDLKNAASPIDAAHSYISSYFPNGGLRLLNVVFDLGTDGKIDILSAVNKVVKGCEYKKSCIVITNRTNDNGDVLVTEKTVESIFLTPSLRYCGHLLYCRRLEAAWRKRNAAGLRTPLDFSGVVIVTGFSDSE
jgi:hypothetical protein